MKLFDTHFHYYAEVAPAVYRLKVQSDLARCKIEPLPEVLYLLAAGGNFKDSAAARDFAAASPENFFAAGVHPHEAADFLASPADFREFYSGERCLAVGEIGLDYYYEFSGKAVQRQVLDHFLALALEFRKPAIIHCRDREEAREAYEDLYAVLRDFSSAGGRMVIHCFTGTPEWAEKMLALGACLGVAGIITFNRAANVREVVRQIPADRLLLETDSPYLAPAPFRGKPCSPGYLPLVAARVAAEWKLPLPEVAELTTRNAFRFFGLEDETSS